MLTFKPEFSESIKRDGLLQITIKYRPLLELPGPGAIDNTIKNNAQEP